MTPQIVSRSEMEHILAAEFIEGAARTPYLDGTYSLVTRKGHFAVDPTAPSTTSPTTTTADDEPAPTGLVTRERVSKMFGNPPARKGPRMIDVFAADLAARDEEPGGNAA
jgi:hypothetical protein